MAIACVSFGTNLVQEHASPHVCQRDEAHDDESADQIALSPCFQNELLRVSRLWYHFVLLPLHVWDGTHGGRRIFDVPAKSGRVAEEA